MDNQVRLLPAVIGAAAVLAVLRLGAMAVGQGETGIAAAAEPAAAAPAPATTTETPTPAPAATPPAAPSDAGQPQSKGEADVLRGLSDRRGELDARENELALREQLLAATQKQVDDKIAQLKQIQGKLDTMLAQRDDAQKAQLSALVKMYEAMKAPDAAKIFEQLDKRILADVAGGMKPAKVGAILAAMEPAKAQELTALLATRLVLPEPQRVAASTPPAAATAATPTPVLTPETSPVVAPPSLPAASPAQAAAPTPSPPPAG